MTIHSFDLSQVTLTLNNQIATGLAEDTMIRLEMDNETFTDNVDSNGDTFRYKNNNHNGKLFIYLNQGSPTNDVLSAVYNVDRQLGNGIFPVLLRDNNGTTVISSIGAFVLKLPPIEFGNTGNNREWVIRMTDVNFFVGGIGK
jgi:arabinogalactan endo-1,4-beta-galactosidase